MKINRIRPVAYGKFQGEGIINLSQGINLIYGANEAGKTTIYNMLMDIIFGIYPASRDKNRNLNQGTSSIVLEAEIDDYTVKRQLRSQIVGSVTKGSQIKKINNNNLDVPASLTRDSYHEIFALSSDDLTNLRDNTWEALNDKLTGLYGTEKYISTNNVLDHLEQKMKKIAKATKRGKSTLKTLEEEKSKLWREKSERNLIEKNYSKLLEDIKAQEKLILSKNKEKETLLKSLELHNRYSHVLKDLGNLNSLQKHIIEMELAYGENLLTCDYDKYKNDKQSLIVIEERIQNFKSKLVSYNNLEKNLLDNKDTFQEKFQGLKSWIKMKEESGRILADLDLEKTSIENTLTSYFGNQKNYVQWLLELDISKLKGQLGRATIKKDSRFVIAETVMSALFALIGLYVLTQNVIIGGLVILVAMLNGVKLVWLYKGNIGSLKMDHKGELLDVLGPDFDENYLDMIDDNITTLLIALKERSFYYTEKLKKQIAERELLDRKINLSAMWLDKYSGSDKENRIEKLESFYNVVMHKYQNNIGKESNILALENEKTEKRIAIQKIDDLFELNKKSDGENAESVLLKYIEVCNDLDKRKNDLEDHYTRELIYEAQSLDDMLLQSINDINVIEINQRLFELNNDLVALYDKLSVLKDSNYDMMNSRDIQTIEAELNSIDIKVFEEKEKWNELYIIKAIIEKAEDRFRDNIQPELVKITEQYLSEITQGKYNRVLMNHGDDNNIYLNGMEDTPLSKGTSQQLYMALRLAIMDIIDEDKVMPIVLDEVFSHWDDDRTNRFISVLRKISHERQIIAFSCKIDIKTKFEALGEASIVELG